MRRNEGSALLVTVLLLVLLGMIGLAALDTTTTDGQVAGYQNRYRRAFYAAEAGIAQGRLMIDGLAPTATPPLPATNLGDTAIYPYGRPSFQGDPAVADPIRAIGQRVSVGGSNIRGGRPALVETLWQVNVLGNSADGAAARIEAVVGTLGGSVGYGG